MQKILDIGCGSGFSIEYLNKLGYKNIIGIDPAKEMIKKAREKKLNVIEGGFLEIPEEIKQEKYKLIISISALQWPVANKEGLELKNIIKKIARNIGQLLDAEGICIIQFYPSTDEIFETVCSAFSREFKLEKYIYNEKYIRKKKYFIILRK